MYTPHNHFPIQIYDKLPIKQTSSSHSRMSVIVLLLRNNDD